METLLIYAPIISIAVSVFGFYIVDRNQKAALSRSSKMKHTESGWSEMQKAMLGYGEVLKQITSRMIILSNSVGSGSALDRLLYDTFAADSLREVEEYVKQLSRKFGEFEAAYDTYEIFFKPVQSDYQKVSKSHNILFSGLISLTGKLMRYNSSYTQGNYTKHKDTYKEDSKTLSELVVKVSEEVDDVQQKLRSLRKTMHNHAFASITGDEI